MGIKEEIGEWFEHFQANTEISIKEFETTAKLAESLSDMGVEHKTFDDVTGVVAEIGEGSNYGYQGIKTLVDREKVRGRLFFFEEYYWTVVNRMVLWTTLNLLFAMIIQNLAMVKEECI